MPEQVEPLNTHQHRDLAMHAVGGEHPHCVQIVIGEVSHAAACCPIFFVKDPETGQFNLMAIFGFRPGDLLVQGIGKATDRGRALFVPLEMIRQGFYADGESIVIDPDHPRFAPGGTIPLFDAMGEPSDEMRLIEPIDISLRFDDGEKLTLEGLYTISLDALQDLPDSDALALFRSGSLATAFAIQGAQKQIHVMAQRKNEKLSAA